jgi:hypothetical protein
MTWRKKWAQTWDRVRYCSDQCRARQVVALDTELEAAIVELLAERPRDAFARRKPRAVSPVRRTSGPSWSLLAPPRVAWWRAGRSRSRSAG